MDFFFCIVFGLRGPSSSFCQLCSPLQHPAFLPQKDRISSEDRYFSSSLHLINLSFPFLLQANFYLTRERSVKALLYVHSHKISLEGKRKAKQSLRHQEILRSPYLQQLNENVKILFKDTTPAIFSGFLLLWKDNVFISNFLLTPAEIKVNTKNQHKLFPAYICSAFA